MLSREIRRRFLSFFKKRGHLEIPQSSLVPEYDPTLLFTNSGMAPLKSYFLGAKNPPAQRLTNVQKCVRTVDIDSVGDIHHLTFFEMMGNWSIGQTGQPFRKEGNGPYFKKEACEFALELLAEFGIDQARLHFGVFAGDSEMPGIPADEETKKAWLSLGIPNRRIIDLAGKDSFWFSGPTGPCGPNTDVLYDLGPEYGCATPACRPTCDCGRFLEIWNAGVFITYNRQPDGSLAEIPFKSVDAGAGLERFAAVLQKGKSVYDTDLFQPIVSEIESLAQAAANEVNQRSVRIMADHVRTAVFLTADGVLPSNVERGYVLRRLIRRVLEQGYLLEINGYFINQLAEKVIENYFDIYPNLDQARSVIAATLENEEKSFAETLKKGLRELNKMDRRIDAFKLFDTFGLPLSITEEYARRAGIEINPDTYDKSMQRQKERARAANKKEGYEPEKVKTAHTAAHLLNAALRKILGNNVHQAGQKISPNRVRHDFTFDRALTPVEIIEVENLINEKIKENLPVVCRETTFEEAKRLGAEALFEEKYRAADKITLYTVGDFSRELCAGPHAAATSELKAVKIEKQASVGKGVRRIYAEVVG